MSLLKVSKSFTLPYRANFLRYVKTTSAYSNNYLNTNLTNINLNYKYAKDVESNIDASSHSVNFKLNKNF